MTVLALFLSGLALSTAVFVALCLTAPHTPAVEAAPSAGDAATEAPVEAGGGAPLPSPASGALDFDAHVEEALAVANAPDDWRLWAKEVAR